MIEMIKYVILLKHRKCFFLNYGVCYIYEFDKFFIQSQALIEEMNQPSISIPKP